MAMGIFEKFLYIFPSFVFFDAYVLFSDLCILGSPEGPGAVFKEDARDERADALRFMPVLYGSSVFC